MEATPSSYHQHTLPPSSSHYPYHHPPPADEPLPTYFHSQHPLQPPVSRYALPHPPPPTHHDEVRTLFIAGLPDDCKSREIYNLFREYPGYVSSHLRSSTDSSRPYAFAVFADQQSAVAAMHALNGLVFDLENNSTLYIDLARSNSKSTKHQIKGVGSNIHMPGKVNSAYSTYDYPSTQSHISFHYDEAHEVDPKKLTSSKTYALQNNPPCPTLFVANLGPTCSEQELTSIFSKYPGFLKLLLQKRNGVSVAFADFQDIASSTEALNSLQGTSLNTSSGDPLRIEYSKSRMGLRKRDRR
ncbi:U1 small nuclear ribonucleoprotein A [Phalaenopsis equestris]|uniref:U1 small nuclear ribonucleoprotein A n=1 Tax=Phalaenopsis equestris TaxID=78828 RepID=UPI0009E4858D|nr:U1 small nuclear ribonucleoprotein A [Phalaenopsis equestris]